MNFLAIDTSSNACSVALQVGDDIAQQHVIEPRAHSKILLPMIRAVLKDAAMSVADLDAVVLGNGPGSFIGMRIGAATAQGLAFGAGINIVPVSSMAAVAAEVIAVCAGDKVLVAQDARMNEIYLGRYHADKDGLPVASQSEQICKVATITGLDAGYVAAGAGWKKYPLLAQMDGSPLEVRTDFDHPRAEYLLGLGAKAFCDRKSVAPGDLQPAYLRLKVANVPTRQN